DYYCGSYRIGSTFVF
nr:immunoglobulin light chain junction region [Macaca mulatta]MOW27333.1 immunoglobulin light chain junction region [Macaca mulatta]MOW27344.1 immunoglobulin light chain junction region [Macaca mulatta]MOW27378.1 immunoglobulin light chain junction region [Macaca mulatta]MOW27396.1 immunoglobulin light chain junction region [Macaca mulatta]